MSGLGLQNFSSRIEGKAQPTQPYVEVGTKAIKSDFLGGGL